MNRIIEIIRKLSLLLVCGTLGIVGLVLMVISDGSTAAGNSDRIFGLVLIGIAIVAYKVINWIFGSKEDSE
jgi:hypothetical protein